MLLMDWVGAMIRELLTPFSCWIWLQLDAWLVCLCRLVVLVFLVASHIVASAVAWASLTASRALASVRAATTA